jgi:hypothetical protein
VLDEGGQIQLEQRVRTTAKELQEIFGAMPRSRIALETGTHSPWISRLLRELGHEVIVANARKVRLIGESRKKDDRLDAQSLARLARIDPELLCPVKHRSAEAQADLMMIREPSSGDCVNRQAHFHRQDEAEVVNQVAAPAETRTPNMRRATRSLIKSADGSMATVVTRPGEKQCFTKPKQNRLDSDRPSHGRR